MIEVPRFVTLIFNSFAVLLQTKKGQVFHSVGLDIQKFV